MNWHTLAAARVASTLRIAAIVAAAALARPVAHAAGPGADDAEIILDLQHSQLTRNVVQRPDTADGTRFDIRPFTRFNGTPWRLEGSWPVRWWGREGQARWVIAPLDVSGEAAPGASLRFDGAEFAAGRPVQVRYKFNTYRLTYSEALADAPGSPWQIRIGGTLALRDARIRLAQDSTVRDFANRGPVPLLYLAARRPLGAGWQLRSEVDAFPAPGGGGLLDAALRVERPVAAGLDLGFGVRHEIGAAVDRSIFNSLRQSGASVSLRGRF